MHIDDKTAWNFPQLRRDCAAALHKYKTDMTGCFDLLQDRIINLFGQAGTSNKDGDTIVCAILLSIIERLNGHQVLYCSYFPCHIDNLLVYPQVVIILLDNCKINKNSLVAIQLNQWIVDLGFADVVMVVFFEQYHGKFNADQRFGAQTAKVSQATIFSLFELMAECEEIQSTQHSKPDLSRSVNPAAMARFGSYMDGVYQRPRQDLSIESDIDDHHVFSAGHLRNTGVNCEVFQIAHEIADPLQHTTHATVQRSVADIINSVTDARVGWMRSIKRPCHHAAGAPLVREMYLYRQQCKLALMWCVCWRVCVCVCLGVLVCACVCASAQPTT